MYPNRRSHRQQSIAVLYPCSLDIVFLYTPKPIEEAITNAAERIQKPILHLSKQDRIDLLTVTLRNMYFSFKGHIFRQSEGLSIDSSISVILAILFMDKRSFLKTTDKRMSTIFIFRQLMKKWQTNSSMQSALQAEN